MIYPANLLITNYCNQNCPFCFASREMKSSTLDKEMKLDDYKKILRKIKRSGHYSAIKLLGGEPTLHSQLFPMLDLAVQEGLQVQIFTNGIMDLKKADKLATYGKKIGYTFNCVTPGFSHNKKIREEVISNMGRVGKKSEITTSVTIDPYFKTDTFIAIAKQSFPLLHSIRIGFSNPILGQKNWYAFSDFHKMGPLMVDFMKKMRANGFIGTFTMNCGFTRCMFTNDEYAYVKKEFKQMGWSCFGKESSMDVAVDMSAFHCFPLSEHKRVDLKSTSYAKANTLFIKERMKLWATVKKDVCLKCPFYGFGGEKCPGPCLAFNFNEAAALKN